MCFVYCSKHARFSGGWQELDSLGQTEAAISGILAGVREQHYRCPGASEWRSGRNHNGIKRWICNVKASDESKTCSESVQAPSWIVLWSEALQGCEQCVVFCSLKMPLRSSLCLSLLVSACHVSSHINGNHLSRVQPQLIEDIHSFIQVTIASILSTHASMPVGWHVRHSKMSSVYWWTWTSKAMVVLVRSAVYKMYNSGPKTERNGCPYRDVHANGDSHCLHLKERVKWVGTLFVDYAQVDT